MKKTAIVTGGSRGIGFAVVRQLGQDGYRVAIFAASPEENHQERLELLKKDGTEYGYIRGDLNSSEDRKLLVKAVVERFGRIDVLVNNAGIAPKVRADLLDMTEESFDRVVGTNTKGTLFLTQLVVKQMLKQPLEGEKRGTIINISSCSSEVVSVNRGEYCISKAGISMVTSLFAARLAGEGILVHEIRPGVIRTDMTQSVTEKYDRLIRSGEFPIARWGTPEDVASAVSLFCSDRMRYTTGDYINIDGGFHIRQL